MTALDEPDNDPLDALHLAVGLHAQRCACGQGKSRMWAVLDDADALLAWLRSKKEEAAPDHLTLRSLPEPDLHGLAGSAPGALRCYCGAEHTDAAEFYRHMPRGSR